MKRRALFGGTFDPVHQGHLRLAQALLTELQLDELCLLPSALPPHRPTGASAEQRVAMLKLALAAYPALGLDLRELARSTPSYTLHSLQEWRAEHPDDWLGFVMGMDSLVNLASWHRWQELTDYAHLVVLARPGEAQPPADSAVGQWLAGRCTDRQRIMARPAGGVLLLGAGEHKVSATALRSAIRDGRDTGDWLVPAVADYIEAEGLYR